MRGGERIVKSASGVTFVTVSNMRGHSVYRNLIDRGCAINDRRRVPDVVS